MTPSTTTMLIDHDDDADDSRPLGTHSHAIRRQHDRDHIAGVRRSAAHRPPYAALRRGPPTNGAALPPRPPTFRAPPARHDPTRGHAQLARHQHRSDNDVMPTPNTSACAESVTMNLATPGTMAPANATGAAATPGVSLLRAADRQTAPPRRALRKTVRCVRAPNLRPAGGSLGPKANTKPYLMVGRIFAPMFLRERPHRACPRRRCVRWPQSGRRTPRLMPPNETGGAVRLFTRRNRFKDAFWHLQAVDIMALVVSSKRTVPGMPGSGTANAFAAGGNQLMAKVLLIEDDSETAEEITAELRRSRF